MSCEYKGKMTYKEKIDNKYYNLIVKEISLLKRKRRLIQLYIIKYLFKYDINYVGYLHKELRNTKIQIEKNKKEVYEYEKK